jgi:lipid II:glycine glycyltransferase (peptidoglycan interpeptide bridge formation enzyme)
MAIIDLQKKIMETEGKLKQQQNLYEAVRSDRNLYSKNLIEAQDEIQEMKRKFKIMNHQVRIGVAKSSPHAPLPFLHSFSFLFHCASFSPFLPSPLSLSLLSSHD